LNQLDSDGSGTLSLADLHTSVKRFVATEKSNKDMKRLIIILCGLLFLALLVMFGVTFASSYAVVLSTRELRSQSSDSLTQPAITNTDKVTTRTAQASLLGYSGSFQLTPISDARRLEYVSVDDEEDLSSFTTFATHRRLQSGLPSGIPVLNILGTASAGIVPGICTMLAEGYSTMTLPAMDPATSDQFISATFLPGNNLFIQVSIYLFYNTGFFLLYQRP
jgi:hypothetical protein